MIQIGLQYVGAKFLSVIAGIAKMQMPDLIHLIGRHHLMAGTECEIAEALIFIDHAPDIIERPAVIAGHLVAEGQIGIVRTELERLKPVPQRIG